MSNSNPFFVSALSGFGWGLLTDEIIPLLKMPSKDRALELSIYEQVLLPTLLLVFCVIALILTIGHSH